MIFPWLRGWREWAESPMTISLLLLNLFFFLITQNSGPAAGERVYKKDSLLLAADLYAQAKAMPLPRHENLQLELGAKALRDRDFLDGARTQRFSGDQVLIRQWQSDLDHFLVDLQDSPVYRFGLASVEQSDFRWITYQFTHANLIHLLSNCAFLLVFGTAIELKWGGLWVLLLYLLGGISGAAMFFMNESGSVAPLVGASAALSAWIGFYWRAESRPNVPFLYFAAPFQGYYGILRLPRWTLLPVVIVPDLTAILSTPGGSIAAVAYLAHLGGLLLGAITGQFWLLMQRSNLPAPNLSP